MEKRYLNDTGLVHFWDKVKSHVKDSSDNLQSQIDDKQNQITANDKDISTLQRRSTQMEESIKGISTTGGASVASAVSFDNKESGLEAVNIQSAVDEVMQKKLGKENIAQGLDYSQVSVPSLSLLNKLSLEGFKYIGVVGKKTSINTYLQNIFCIAKETGVYENLGNIEVKNLSILYKRVTDETWSIQPIIDSILQLDKFVFKDFLDSQSFIKITDGTLQNTSYEWYTTTKLYLSVGTIIEYSYNTITSNAAVIAAYDKDGNYLKDKSVGNSADPITGTYTVQDGTAFVRFCWYDNDCSIKINGVYKSLIDRNIAITNKNSKALEEIFVVNALNFPKSQAYIRYDNGNSQPASYMWFASERIYLSVGTKIDYKYGYATSNAAVIAAYDKDGNYLKDKSVGNSADPITGTYTVQDGTAFVRFCWYSYSNHFINIRDSYQKNVERISSIKDAMSSIQSLSDIDTIKTKIESINTDINNIKKTKADSYIYKTSVRKPFEFNGKKALFCGDSITYGFTSGSTHVKGTGDYPKLLSEKVGLTYSNVGVAGATIAKVDNYGFIFNQISSIDPTYNYLFIAGGVNDWQLGVSLSSFREAVKYYCDYINKNLSNSLQVIWITPINQGGYEDTHPEISARVKGTLQEFRNAMTEVISANDTYSRFSIIQGNEFNFPTKDMNADYISFAFGDRLHPSEAAYKSLYLTGLQNALL